MLDFDTALSLMRKYGYSSTSVHPYIYKKDETVGICYSFVDENFGILERVKFFDNPAIMEEFLKRISWVKQNGKNYNVRMILDNYESIDPKVIFLRNEKIMVKGEMFDIEGFDRRASEQQKLDDISRIILQAGNLLLVYDDLKNRQIDYFLTIIKLKNDLKNKYLELQKEVDLYNGNNNPNREVVFLKEIVDLKGIDEITEISLKDRYNYYKVNHPSREEAIKFVREVWDLNFKLESNINYYMAQVEENNVRNEERVVDSKLSYMKELNAKEKSFFKKDLMKKFREINDECAKSSALISDSFIQEKISSVMKKYSFFDSLDLFKVSDYLKEAIQNTNYGDLAVRYSKQYVEEVIKLPLNEIATDLIKQYKEKLSLEEQTALILYNSKYRRLFEMILSIKDFDKLGIADILKILNSDKNFSKVKTESFDYVKQRINAPVNAEIKNRLFLHVNFDNLESFIGSIIYFIKVLKSMDNKMVLNSDLNMYFLITDVEDIEKKYFMLVSNDLNSMYAQVKDSDDMIAITLLKHKTPILYSPYFLDFGDLYSKESVEFKLKQKNNFELLIDVEDVIINRDDVLTTVVKYYSRPQVKGDVTVVSDISKIGQTVFCKLALTSKNNNENERKESLNG